MTVIDVAALDERMSREAAPVGFAALLMNLYGVLALLLAALAVYGVLAAGVASRRRELAIRAALGAAPQGLWLGVVREGLTGAIASVACGVVITFVIARATAALIFEVSATDPLLLAAAAALLIVAALVASLLPARHAPRVDPANMRRGEP